MALAGDGQGTIVDGVSRHYAFISFPGFGHVTPVVPVIEELVRRGHRVTHFVAEDYEEDAVDSGARVVPYFSDFPEPFGHAESVEEAAQMLVDLMRQGFAPLRVAMDTLDDDRPDLILHDDISTHTARLLAEHWGVPLIRLYAHFVHAGAVAEASRQPGPIDTAEVLRHPMLAQAWRAEFDALVPMGFQLSSAMDVLMREDVAANIVFMPRSFQPGVDAEFTNGRYVFVGSSLHRPSPLPWRPPEGKRVALASLGTSLATAPAFFRACADAFADRDWHVVLTVGSRTDPAEIGSLPPNVELHAWLPHSVVLPHTSIFVGACGMNTTMAVFDAEIPMIAVPGSTEQLATAQRIDQLGLGRMLELDKVTPDAVYSAVSDVLADSAVAARVRAMSQQIKAAGGVSRTADEIEACTPALARS